MDGHWTVGDVLSLFYLSVGRYVLSPLLLGAKNGLSSENVSFSLLLGFYRALHMCTYTAYARKVSLITTTNRQKSAIEINY